jgi:hypothetical protein
MQKSSKVVQKVDIGVPVNLLAHLARTLRRIRHSRETWMLSFYGVKISRERIETTTELERELSA